MVYFICEYGSNNRLTTTKIKNRNTRYKVIATQLCYCAILVGKKKLWNLIQLRVA